MIHFFCALYCEAEPLIQYFKLNELKQFDLFRIYQSDDHETSLTITGTGKLDAAAAVSYQHACLATDCADIRLNIGIAGHGNIPVGEARLAHKLMDAQQKSCWYPQILFDPVCGSETLITLDASSTDYQDSLLDMEASGFYSMAIRLGIAELTQVLKIVSDNPETSLSTINKSGIKKLVSRHIETIEQILAPLKQIGSEYRQITSTPEGYQQFIERWHFTQSERIRLLSLLRHWRLRLPKEDALESVTRLETGKQVLNELNRRINNADYCLYD